jgi:hypothetical protein
MITDRFAPACFGTEFRLGPVPLLYADVAVLEAIAHDRFRVGSANGSRHTSVGSAGALVPDAARWLARSAVREDRTSGERRLFDVASQDHGRRPRTLRSLFARAAYAVGAEPEDAADA